MRNRVPLAQTYVAVPLKGMGSPNHPVILRLVTDGGTGGRRQATQSQTWKHVKGQKLFSVFMVFPWFVTVKVPIICLLLYEIETLIMRVLTHSYLWCWLLMLSRGLCQIANTILSGKAKQEIRGIALGGSKICTPAFKNKWGPFCNNLSLKAVGPFEAAFLCFLVQADTLLVRTAFGRQLCLPRDYSLSSCF